MKYKYIKVELCLASYLCPSGILCCFLLYIWILLEFSIFILKNYVAIVVEKPSYLHLFIYLFKTNPSLDSFYLSLSHIYTQVSNLIQ